MGNKLAKLRKPIFEAIGQILIAISIISAVVYGVESTVSQESRHITFYASSAKSIAIGTLALFALMNAARMDILGLAIALTINALGDILIIGSDPRALNYALYAYAISHALYFIIFAVNMAPLSDMSALRLKFIALLWAVYGLAGFWFWPELSPGYYWFIGYSVLLLLMTTAALMSRFPVILVGFGAVLFLLSDALIGAGILIDLTQSATNAVWPTFYLAQLLITLGIVLTPKNEVTVRRRYRFD